MKHSFLPPIVLVLFLSSFGIAAEDLDPPTLPGTPPLEWTEEPSVRIVEEAHRYLDQKLAESVSLRQQYWKRDFSSPAAYRKSIEPNRQRLKKIIGVVDQRLPVVMEHFGDDQNPALVAETDRYGAYQVRWEVLDGVFGEGLLLVPEGDPVAQVVAIPDADQTPEQIVGLAPGVAPEAQFARRLAENGCRVVVPVLISRACDFSGNPEVRMTNQPHREWVYRQAYEMGRHVIGYEVQKVLGVVDWFQGVAPPGAKTAVVGYAEGGLIAFYSAAVDERIDAVLVSGYFDSRQGLWQEPIYRNVWGLLGQFGDAEIASLIVPRALVVEYSPVPEIDGPPAVEGRRPGAAPGKLGTPRLESVKGEFQRATALDRPGLGSRHIVHGPSNEPIGPGSQGAMVVLGKLLGLGSEMALGPDVPKDERDGFDPAARQRRQVKQLTDHIQLNQRTSDGVRDRFFLEKANHESAEAFAKSARPFRQYLWQEVIGALDDPLVEPNARSRKLYSNPKWIGYEVVLDVWPGVHAWGILCAPRDIQPGERRPVVVCQHGLEGLPEHTILRAPGERFFRAYQGFAAALAERGFITFAPFNLYRTPRPDQDEFRLLQRKANPLQASLFSIITRQHEQILNWLGSLAYVDKDRIGFYGLSYGGKTAMRVPALLEGYALSICSADFNDWVRKNVSVHARYSYMFTREWEMFEFDLGNTFNYAEMAYLIFPRPFMVERGHHDGVAPDHWVAYEYAKIRRLYDILGQGDKTEIEFFDGPHSIHGQGTFEFLHKHLDWPKPDAEPQP